MFLLNQLFYINQTWLVWISLISLTEWILKASEVNLNRRCLKITYRNSFKQSLYHSHTHCGFFQVSKQLIIVQSNENNREYEIPACRQVLVLQADGMCEDVKFVPLHFSVSLLSRLTFCSQASNSAHHPDSCHSYFLQPVCWEKDFLGEDYVVGCVKLMKTNAQYCKSLPLCCRSEYLGKWCSGTCCLGAECTCVLTEV